MSTDNIDTFMLDGLKNEIILSMRLSMNLLGALVTTDSPSTQEILCCLALGETAMNILGCQVCLKTL